MKTIFALCLTLVLFSCGVAQGAANDDQARSFLLNVVLNGADATLTNGFGGLSNAIWSITNRIINVRNYGAIGNGVADDSAAFQAATNAAGTTNVIYVPPGTYSISPLTLTASMFGNGPFSRLVYRDLTDNAVFLNVPRGRFLRDVSVSGTNGNFQTGLPLSNTTGVQHDSRENGYVQNVDIANFTQGLVLEGTNDIFNRPQNAHYTSINVSNCYNGIYTVVSNRAEYIRVDNCSVIWSFNGLYAGSSANMLMTGCKFTDNSNGVVIVPSATASFPYRATSSFVNCQFNHCGLKYVDATDAMNATFRDCHMLGSGTISLTRCTNFQFVGNYFEFYPGPTAITFSGGAENVFENNFLTAVSSNALVGNISGNMIGLNNRQFGYGLVWDDSYVQSAVTNVSAAASATFGDVTSVSITPGLWEGRISANLAANASVFSTVAWDIGISTTSGNSFPEDGSGVAQAASVYDAPTTFLTTHLGTEPFPFRVTTTTTYYWKSYVGAYTGGPPKINGVISFRRISR